MQTAYSTSPAAAFAGMPGDTGVKHDDTYRAAEAIPFGRFVVDNADGTCSLPSETGEDIAGAALHCHLEQDDDGVAQYAAGDAMAVRKLGRIWVTVEQDVTPADPVYVRFTANGAGTAAGQARKDADTDKADAFTAAKFVTSASAGELVLVSINNL